MNLANNAQISERLIIARITAGYRSSRSFAEENLLPRASYTAHEANKRKMTAESIVEYSNALKVNVSWLLTGEGYPSQSPERNKNIIQYLYEHRSELSQDIDIPKIHEDQICTIEVTTLHNILLKLISTATKNKLNINCEDLLDFAYKLYNNICSTLDTSSRNKMIEIAAESLINANILSDKAQKTKSNL